MEAPGVAPIQQPFQVLARSRAFLVKLLIETVIADHLADPPQILRRATARMVYDLLAHQRTKDQPDPQPAVVYTLARETHDSDPAPAGGLKIQHSFSYSDGFGREVQRKAQTERGPVPTRDATGKIIVGPKGEPEMTPNEVNPRSGVASVRASIINRSQRGPGRL